MVKYFQTFFDLFKLHFLQNNINGNTYCCDHIILLMRKDILYLMATKNNQYGFV